MVPTKIAGTKEAHHVTKEASTSKTQNLATKIHPPKLDVTPRSPQSSPNSGYSTTSSEGSSSSSINSSRSISPISENGEVRINPLRNIMGLLESRGIHSKKSKSSTENEVFQQIRSSPIFKNSVSPQLSVQPNVVSPKSDYDPLKDPQFRINIENTKRSASPQVKSSSPSVSKSPEPPPVQPPLR